MPPIGSLFLLLGCCSQLQYDGFCFILLYFVLLCLVVLSLRGLLFSEGNLKRSGSEEGGGRTEEWKEGKLW